MVANDQQAALGKRVEIGQIEAELHRLWEADATSTKASLINFAIYSEQPDELEHNTQIINEITRTHACRAILIEADLDAPASNARAWITAHCHLLGGKKSVCSEQITFELEGKAIGRIRNIVFAHLASDLPLVFWWQGEFSRIFEPGLYTQLDRLIIDSSSWHDLPGNTEKLLAALEAAPDSQVIHDLSWSRSYQLRLAFALMFDEPQAREHLAQPLECEICYQSGQLATAMLLLAWLIESLGWQITGLQDGGLKMKTSDGHVFDFTLKPAAAATRAITRLGLRTPTANFFVIPDESDSFYRTRAELDGSVREQLLPIDPVAAPTLVASQLARAGHNRMYRKLLPRLLDACRIIKDL